MTIKSLYPASRPALGIDFAKTKRLDPRVTFTRVMTGASVATYVGADGLIKTANNNVPRFDHNPTTGESLGLLVEEARTNLQTFSQGSTLTAGGTGTGSITYNAGVAPDGTATATSVKGVYTYSAAWPAAGGNYGGSYFAEFNASTGVITKSGNFGGYIPANHTTFVTMLGNGWYRISQGFSGQLVSLFVKADGANVIKMESYIDTLKIYVDGTSTTGFLVWGAQLEAGSFPTSYIPTSGSTVTRTPDVATLSNANSSIFPTSAFTTINSPFGTAGGGSTVKLVGPTIKRTAIYAGDLPQAQINALAGVNDGFWRWRVLGSSFALPNFTTNGSVTVDWGDGVVETLTTAVHTFTNGGGYHDIGFRLNSGTFFRPNISGNGTYKDRVIAVGPAPASMRINGEAAFQGCGSLRSFDATVDATGGTSFSSAWYGCSSLSSFPLINTAGATNFYQAWYGCSSLNSFPLVNTANATSVSAAWFNCSSLASFPLINTAAVTSFYEAWKGCSSLTSFPLINTASGTNFKDAWQNCTSLTSFPLINTGAGTNFQTTWNNCPGLTSFPLINTASGTNFQSTWNGCSSLTSFPANVFNTTGTLIATAFSGAFSNCALTAASIENILTSLVTNGQSNITLTLSGGTNAGAATWTTAANTAYATLISRGWTITRNA